MNIATAITTAPREEYWLGQCVEGLVRAVAGGLLWAYARIGAWWNHG